MNNPYYIEPANFMQGLNALGNSITGRIDLMRRKAEIAKENQMRDEALKIFKEGTPDQLTEFMVKNPGSDKILDPVIKFRSDETKRNMAETSMDALSAKDDQGMIDSLIKRAEFVKEKGGDPSGTIALVQLAMKDPQSARQRIEMALAYTDKDTYNAYKEMKYGKDENKPQVSGDYAAYQEDVKSGNFKGSYIDWKKAMRPDQKAQPDVWDDWGYGKKRNRRTGEIKSVPVKPESKPENGESTQDAKDIADGIASGKLPPTMVSTIGRKESAKVAAELARKGIDLSSAITDFKAVQKRVASMNTVSQQRLFQAVDFANHSLSLVEDLAGQWKAGGFPAMNKARLMAAKQGVFGQEAQSIATKLENQISDLQSELATVYKGGNSSTDQGLAHASKQLRSEWSEKTLYDNVRLIRKNLDLRMNSMKSIPTMGASDQNKYETKKQPIIKTDQKTKPMLKMPDAIQNKGRVIRDTDTGKRYRSNGSKWTEIK